MGGARFDMSWCCNFHALILLYVGCDSGFCLKLPLNIKILVTITNTDLFTTHINIKRLRDCTMIYISVFIHMCVL